MQIALVVAFVVVGFGPLVGIWRGQAWAKAHGLTLRTTTVSKTRNQAA